MQKTNPPGNKLKSSDIKFLNFDNTNILKAVKCFNKARSKQPERDRGNIDINKLIIDPDWNQGIRYIEQQFDCHLMIRFYESKHNKKASFSTSINSNIKPNITISKSKGFQLHGMPIDIEIRNHGLDLDTPNDITLFGQSVVAAILHEIFHNIAYVLTLNNIIMNASLQTTMEVARGMKRGKDRRLLFSKYVDTLEDFSDIKINKKNKHILIKDLSVLSTFNNIEDISTYQNIINANNYSDIDKLIKAYEKRISEGKRKQNVKTAKNIINIIITACLGIIGHLLLDAFSIKGLAVYLLYGLTATAIGAETIHIKRDISFDNQIKERYENSIYQQEYYCDMFAAMYKLPVTLMTRISSKRAGKSYTANQIPDEKLNKLIELDRTLKIQTRQKYPSTYERNFAAVKVAKQLLSSDDIELDNSIKEYLQWIVDNYSKLLDTNIENDYNKTTFDPSIAEDLDKYLDTLINQNNIKITECFKYFSDNNNFINEGGMIYG